MWKRDQAVKPMNGQPTTPAASSQQAVTLVEPAGPPRTSERKTPMVSIGKSIVIKGELTGSEDLMIDGHVEGKIELKDHVLTIGHNGKIQAKVYAKSVVVQGTVDGDITASDRVEIHDGGSVDGDVVSPRVTIIEGAHFHGSVDMQKKGARPAQSQSSASGKPRAAHPAVSAGPEAPRAAAPSH